MAKDFLCNSGEKIVLAIFCIPNLCCVFTNTESDVFTRRRPFHVRYYTCGQRDTKECFR